MNLGKLIQIWRYPVKSMGGERISSGVINNNGLAGDRCWAVINKDSHEIYNAKRWPELLNYQANLKAGESLQSSGFAEEVPDVDIHCPNGETLTGRAPDIATSLSLNLDKQADLVPLVHPDHRDHYRLAKARTEKSIASEMQLFEDEAFPDFSSTPSQIMSDLAECVTPPGTYVDAFPLHMITTNSLQYLLKEGNVDAVVERYRPNLMIEPSSQLAEMTENSWLNYRIQIGEAILHIHSRTVRCSMPSREQQWCDIKAEKTMARAMVDHCDRHLGVNVLVEKSGIISVGDELVLLT